MDMYTLKGSSGENYYRSKPHFKLFQVVGGRVHALVCSLSSRIWERGEGSYTSSAATLKPTWNIRAVGCCDLSKKETFVTTNSRGLAVGTANRRERPAVRNTLFRTGLVTTYRYLSFIVRERR